jgi:hypothetical protein
MNDPTSRHDALPFATGHPAFAPLPTAGTSGALPDIPTLERWAGERALALADGTPLRFAAAPTRRCGARDYERGIAATGVVPTREGSLHDACNALAWLAYPRTKAALNAIHVGAVTAATPNARDRRRDAATLLDESGLVIACGDEALLAGWRDRAWHDVFWRRRADVAREFRVAAIGHGLLAKLLRPFRAVTAQVLVLPLASTGLPHEPVALASALDAAAAAWLGHRGSAFHPADLLPLPVAALPGWDSEGSGERLFDDRGVFRPARDTLRGTATSC